MRLLWCVSETPRADLGGSLACVKGLDPAAAPAQLEEQAACSDAIVARGWWCVLWAGRSVPWEARTAI